VILFVVICLLLRNTFIEREVAEALPSSNLELQAENEEILKEVEEITTLLYSEGGLFELVNNNLQEKGYTFQMLLAIYSKDDIRVKYILDNKEVTKSIQEDITTTFYEFVENYHLDSNSFDLKVADKNDGRDW
jgi:hypothetical protein